MMRVDAIEYDVDGVAMIGYLAIDDSAPRHGPSRRRAGVLLLHEGSGLDDNVRARAKRLAGLGYASFALDYFGGGRQPPFDEAQARMSALLDSPDPTPMRRLGRAGLDVLMAQPEVDVDRLAAIGFCFGGTMALELARDGAPLRVVVGFHPGLYSTRPADSANIGASVLICCGADDPIISSDARRAFEDEMRAAGVDDWRLELYGGVGHSFTNPDIDARALPGFAYDERADRRSWESMLELLHHRLG